MRVGMIGLGVMGHGMASNIIKHGYALTVYDLRPECYADLLGENVKAVNSLEELSQETDTILMIVNAYKNCESIMSELVKTKHGGTVVNMSTISMDDAKKLEKMAAESGISMLDCPVSGGTAGAKNGTLTMMAAGSDELFEAHKPLFESYCGNVVHVGKEVGQGQAFKAVNQLLVGVHMCAAAEAFTMARKCGLDLQVLYDTIKTSAGTSRIFENRGQFVIDRDFSIRSTLTIQLKDTDIACKTAESVGAPALLGNVARQLFNMAVRQFPPNDDSIEVIRLYEKMADICADEL